MIRHATNMYAGEPVLVRKIQYSSRSNVTRGAGSFLPATFEGSTGGVWEVVEVEARALL